MVSQDYTLRYCIACEEWVDVYKDLDGHSILVGDWPFEVDWCDGYLATSTPPENFDVDWEMQPEPSPEELELMDVCAKYLMEEF